MNLEELKLQVSQDLRVDDEHLDTESLKNQEIKAKYKIWYISENLKLKE